MSESHHHPKLAESSVSISACRDSERRRLFWVLAISVVVMAGEFAGGFWTHSLALLNDAVHMLTHVLALGLSWLAVVAAARPAPPDKTYRWWRLEILASLVSGLSLVPLSAWMIWESVERWNNPVPIHLGGMMAVGTIGLVANLVSAALLHRHSDDDLNIRGAFLHLVADSLSSVGVIGAGALVWFTGWEKADPLIAGAISLLILGWCWTLVRDSGRILLESAPGHLKLDEISDAMKGVDGVLEVHDLHVWTITSRMHALTAHVRLREDLPVSQAELIGGALKKLLDERFEINHATLQYEVHPGEELACERSGHVHAPGHAHPH